MDTVQIPMPARKDCPDGHVAEWLRNGLQNRVPRFNSGRGLQPFPGHAREGALPSGAVNFAAFGAFNAGRALLYAPPLTRAGYSPVAQW
jgi:hypothetical protein